MKEAAQQVVMPEPPRLLIEWSSPWQEFVTAILPALHRSPKRLAGEARTGIFPFSGMLATWILEAVSLLAVIILPGKLSRLQPYTPLPQPKYDVIYFSGEELPQTADVGGAKSGKSGRAGGHEGYHRTQTIRVARGDSPAEKVVDVPKLNLPKSDFPVANLLAINRIPGPPPASGLRSSLPALPSAAPVPPPPDIARDKIQAAPGLNSSIVAPPPKVSRDKMQAAAMLNSSIVAPPPDVAREKMQALAGVNTGVVAPPPTVHDIAGARVAQGPVTNVVPPPVSAPVNTTSVASRLSLPQPSVIAPPPSRVTRENGSILGTQVTDIQKQVVPPPVQLGGAGGVTGRQMGGGGGVAEANNIVPPPPSLGRGSSLAGGGGRRTAGEPVGAAGVVPPPPSVSGGSSLTGRGRGNAGTGLGGALDAGSVLAPPKGGGGTGSDKAGVVISSQPGSRFGVPGSGGSGSLAMSPAGGAKPGLGGSGGGNGIGRGTGPGSGLEGEGSGAGKAGTGRGSDPNAKGGISPYPGPGGAGKGTNGSPAAPGISVAGGATTITLPSFGSPADPPDLPAHSGAGAHRGPGITIVATSRSGGAFNFYGALPGDNYTIYIETTLGPAVLQYADPTSAKRAYSEELTPPEPMRTSLPAGLSHSRMIVACVLDRSGLLRNLHTLEAGPAEMNSKVLAALHNWKFRAAMRGNEPVEVNAILGFNIDTR
ncbi:MAG TPA: hypothetical protein VEV41_03680 [Terriglobales bacterium]|nr:hypothetical protein [Terriglobales bacterium]